MRQIEQQVVIRDVRQLGLCLLFTPLLQHLLLALWKLPIEAGIVVQLTMIIRGVTEIDRPRVAYVAPHARSSIPG